MLRQRHTRHLRPHDESPLMFKVFGVSTHYLRRSLRLNFNRFLNRLHNPLFVLQVLSALGLLILAVWALFFSGGSASTDNSPGVTTPGGDDVGFDPPLNTAPPATPQDSQTPHKSNQELVKEKMEEMKAMRAQQIRRAARQKTSADTKKRDAVLAERREAVREAMLHSFNGYAKYAMGHDEVHPVTNATNDSWGGFGVSLVDGLDTMIIMNLQEAMQATRKHIQGIDWDKDWNASFFETTIRYLGGLLGAYTLSEDPLFLDKARQLADRLLPAFDSPTGIPYSIVNLRTGKAFNPSWTQGNSLLSELGSVQLEFKYLSYLVQDTKYAEAATRVMTQLSRMSTDLDPPGLYPTYINPETGRAGNQHISYGGLGDSFYEYLLKQHLLSNKTEPLYRRMYDQSTRSMIETLLGHTQADLHKHALYFIREMQSKRPIDKQDHLVCYVPGMLALGAQGDTKERELLLARELLRTCWQTYTDQPTGLGPEAVEFPPATDNDNDDGPQYRVPPGATHYLLRPETIESMFVLYRITGESVYQEWAWQAFQAINTHCRTETAFSGLKDVTRIHKDARPGRANPLHNNSMQSFFWAETLKYLYLIFSPTTVLPLDQYVFNTEAHPFRVFGNAP